MKNVELAIDGVSIYEFLEFTDNRGSFSEIFDLVDFKIAQINRSISNKGVLRGIHFADVPPGQSKYVTCLKGAILDVVVDLRKSSPTFKQWIAVQLTESNNLAISIPVGIGHGFLALEENSTVMYACDQRYNPKGERELDPFDKSIGIEWPKGFEFSLSEKDKNAPSLEELYPLLPN